LKTFAPGGFAAARYLRSDMDAILNNLEALLFLLIFLASIISSFIKRRKPADMADDDGDTPAPSAPPPSTQRRPQAPPPARQPRPQSVNVEEEMRRALDDIFAAKQPPSYENRRQAAAYDDKKSLDVRTRANAQPQANKRLVRAPAASGGDADAEWTLKALRARDAKEAAKAAAKERTDYEEILLPPTPIAAFNCDQPILEQARNGVIWSEILQPPVSMR